MEKTIEMVGMEEDRPIRTAEEMETIEAIENDGGKKVGGIRELFEIETGEGAIDEYIDDPLNISGSKGWAQWIRGLYGLIGDVYRKSALVDMIIGSLKIWKESRGARS